MNFTREPIIETIITPKEGFKLLVKNSKGGSKQEYSVDAVEVVSFGHSFFYRCLERPKSFLVPISDYEIVEVKETRVVLKSATLDKSIKIGGGKAPEQTPAADLQRLEKKRERRRHKRRPADTKEESQKEETPKSVENEPIIFAEKAVPLITRLIPPPTQLISETLIKENVVPEKEVSPPEKVEEEKPKKEKVAAKTTRRKPKKKDEEPPPKEGEPGEVKRTAAEIAEPISSTSYSELDSDFYPPFGSDLF